MARRIKDAKVTAGYPISSSSGRGEERKYFQFHIHDFTNLRTTRDHSIVSPKFTCNGHQWELWVYPGGNSEAAEGRVSLFLYHVSEETITTGFGIKVLDKFGNEKKSLFTKHEFTADTNLGFPMWGWKDFISRTKILDESQNILDDNGKLTIVVSVEEEPTTAFVPENPLLRMMQAMFNDEATADVCFEVSTADEGKGETPNKSSVSFFAHRLILQICAPMLAAICGSNNYSGGVVTASVDDIKPEIFNHLLSYVYGKTIPEEEVNAHAKDIIDAADKYFIVHLKLAAEAAYVQSTKITFDNAMDNLLYADSKHLALLKEAVIDFLAENDSEAAAQISFTDFPGHIVKDLLIAFGKSKKKVAGNGTNVDDLTTLSVSALRRKLHMMDLEVDGSREAMIESIKRSS